MLFNLQYVVRNMQKKRFQDAVHNHSKISIQSSAVFLNRSDPYAASSRIMSTEAFMSDLCHMLSFTPLMVTNGKYKYIFSCKIARIGGGGGMFCKSPPSGLLWNNPPVLMVKVDSRSTGFICRYSHKASLIHSTLSAVHSDCLIVLRESQMQAVGKYLVIHPELPKWQHCDMHV